MATINQIREMAGTEVKINISVEPIGDIHMDDYDFECLFYTYFNSRENTKKNVKISKAEMLKVDADNYIARVDTGIIGAGEIMCKLTAYIPDIDMDDNLRTEIVTFRTGIIMH